MTIVLPVVAVVALAVFAVGAAVLSAMAANRPGRAAMAVVLVGAGLAGVVALGGVAVFGIAGLEQALTARAVRRAATVDVHPVRLALGLTVAAILLGTATWLVRTGDWARVDRDDGDGAGAA